MVTVKQIKLLCVLASQEGLNRVKEEYPDLEVRTKLITCSRDRSD